MAKKNETLVSVIALAVGAWLLGNKQNEEKIGKVASAIVYAANDPLLSDFDFSRGFYELSYSDISLLEKLRRKYKYSGNNSYGRSPVQQFYYRLQEHFR